MSNQLPKRMDFLREKLGLTRREIYIELKIPQSSFSNIETGHKVFKHDYYLRLARFFDKKWQDKYGKRRSYPSHGGILLEDITATWLIFGEDPYVEKTNRFIESIQTDFRRREHEMVEELLDIKVMLENATNKLKAQSQQ